MTETGCVSCRFFIVRISFLDDDGLLLALPADHDDLGFSSGAASSVFGWIVHREDSAVWSQAAIDDSLEYLYHKWCRGGYDDYEDLYKLERVLGARREFRACIECSAIAELSGEELCPECRENILLTAFDVASSDENIPEGAKWLRSGDSIFRA